MEFNEENFKTWHSALNDYARTQGVEFSTLRFGMYKDSNSSRFNPRRYNDDAVDVSPWANPGSRVLLNWYLLTNRGVDSGLAVALCDIRNAFPREVRRLARVD